MAQGRVAGANAVAAVAGHSLASYVHEDTPLMFRSKDVEMYALGDPGDANSVEWDPGGTGDQVFRALVLRGRKAVGVQLVGTCQGLDGYLALVRSGAEVEGH